MRVKYKHKELRQNMRKEEKQISINTSTRDCLDR